jgi:hypothetical protein
MYFTHLFVQHYEAFLELCKKTLVKFYGEDPQRATDFGRIVSTQHCQRLKVGGVLWLLLLLLLLLLRKSPLLQLTVVVVVVVICFFICFLVRIAFACFY